LVWKNRGDPERDWGRRIKGNLNTSSSSGKLIACTRPSWKTQRSRNWDAVASDQAVQKSHTTEMKTEEQLRKIVEENLFWGFYRPRVGEAEKKERNK